MNEVVLTLNAGSSSVKFALYQAGGSALELIAKGQVEGIGSAPHFVAKDATGALLAESYWEPVGGGAEHTLAFRQIWHWLSEVIEGERLVAVGHRVAHGGEHYAQAVLIDDQVVADLNRLIPLVPLHQPHNLAAMHAVSKSHPQLPQVACFDTAFHRQRLAVSERFGLPFEFYEKGVRRYGFHGISYEYIISRLGKIAPDLAQGRVVVAHLGSGCSMCAIHRGKSVETTMSFSALDGLPMGTRCGTLDPGVLLYLMRREHMSVEDLEDLLYKRSGLLGISGMSNDMRALQQSDDPRARDAVDYFVYRIGYHLGALTACLGGLDALVFTAGIGENDAALRARVCREAAWLGIEINREANEQRDLKISVGDATPSVWVIPTDEERMIAIHTLRLVGAVDDFPADAR
jgi:acetate kinase